MKCHHFGICGGCSLELEYDAQVESKKQYFFEIFNFYPNEVFTSPDSGFRARAELRIHRHNHLDKSKPLKINLSMNALNKNSRIPITSCKNLLPILDQLITELPKILEQSPILEQKLYAINLLANTKNECIITLIYHKTLDSIWEENARELFNTLGLSKNSGIIGISKRQEILINTKTLTQSMTLNYPFAKNHQIHLSHLAGTFSQPNPFINQKMLQYIIDSILLHPKKDLLELYCGSGNFTIALAPLFKKVFATEVVKTALSMVSQNAKQNHISNITCARLSGSESIEALSFKRDFFRLKDIDLKDFSFSHILVDPPRSGINDREMLEFMGNFEYILYISCNVLSLKKDLAILSKTHKVIHSAIFDQFPHTTHLESAMILQKLRHLDE